MFNQDKALQQLKKLFNNSPVRTIPATVLSIEGGTCTVQPFGSELTLPGVGLFAKTGAITGTVTDNSLSVDLSPIPAIGSTVLVAVFGGKVDMNDLSICGISQTDSLQASVGPFTIDVNQDAISITGPSGRVELSPERLLSILATS